MSIINILFLGDIVGRPGRKAVIRFLEQINKNFDEIKNQDLMEVKPDFIVANIENASHGFGLTRKNHNELSEAGIDFFTSGNHVWDKKEIFEYIDESEKLIRPMNYPETVPGTGYRVIEKNGVKLAVTNLLGKVFMPDIDNPWDILEKNISKIKEEADVVLLDFHAEATAEKMAFGYFADNLGINAFIGTHTHIQTADEKILKNGCAYITDAGFCGASNGVIGMEFENSYQRFRTYLPERYEVAISDDAEINGVVVSIDTQTSSAVAIKRIKYLVNLKVEG